MFKKLRDFLLLLVAALAIAVPGGLLVARIATAAATNQWEVYDHSNSLMASMGNATRCLVLGTNSSFAYSRTAVAAQTYNATVPLASIYGVTNTTYAGNVVFNLPLASTVTVGQVVIVKDEIGTSGTNAIVITPHSGDTIDGASTKTLSTNTTSTRLYRGPGVDWKTI